MTQLLMQSVGLERWMAFHCLLLVWISYNVREYGFRNPGNFCFWNPGSCPWETEIQLQETGIPLTFAMRNPSSTQKDLESSNWNPESRIPDCLGSIYTCKGIRIPESRKFLPVESGILGFGIRNTAVGIWNPTDNWNPETEFHWKRSGIQ